MSLVNREIRRQRMQRRNDKIEQASFGCTYALGMGMLHLLRALTRPFRRG